MMLRNKKILEGESVESEMKNQVSNLLEDVEAKNQLLEQHWEDFRRAQTEWMTEKTKLEQDLQNEKQYIQQEKLSLKERENQVENDKLMLSAEKEELLKYRKDLEEQQTKLARDCSILQDDMSKLSLEQKRLEDEKQLVVLERQNLSGESDRIQDEQLQLEAGEEKLADAWKALEAAQLELDVAKKTFDCEATHGVTIHMQGTTNDQQTIGKLEEEILVAKRIAEESRLGKEKVEKDFLLYKTSQEKDFQEKQLLESKISDLQARLTTTLKRLEHEKTLRKRAELGIHEDGSMKIKNRKRIRTISESGESEQETFPVEEDVLLMNAAGSSVLLDGAAELPKTNASTGESETTTSNKMEQVSKADQAKNEDGSVTPMEDNPSDQEDNAPPNQAKGSSKYYDPVTCEACGKRCFNASTLKRHSLMHLPSQESKRFSCDRCGRKFSRKDNCRFHVRQNKCVAKEIAKQ